MTVECSDEMSLQERWPHVYDQLLELRDVLEKHLRDVCDIEFVVERGQLYLLNVRRAKRTVIANLRFALQLFEEGTIGLSEAIARVTPNDVEAFGSPLGSGLES